MKKAKLIKKTELAEQKPIAQRTNATRQRLPQSTQQTLQQWVRAQQNTRPQNARAAFAALFTAGD
jgi:hypothetical protein